MVWRLKNMMYDTCKCSKWAAVNMKQVTLRLELPHYWVVTALSEVDQF